MITAKEIDRQLKNIGVSFWFLGNAELRELRHILVDGEVIEHCILGRYEGGFAVLCTTNLRLLLIDKKPFYLTLEDVRYDMIVEVDFARRLIDATIKVCTPNKTLNFTSTKKHEARLMTAFIQDRVLAYRQQHVMETQYAQPQQQITTVPVQQFQFPAQEQPRAWQPQMLIEQPKEHSPHSIKNIAQTALDGATRVAEVQPMTRLHHAINPYARSSFTMRQRISRF